MGFWSSVPQIVCPWGQKQWKQFFSKSMIFRLFLTLGLFCTSLATSDPPFIPIGWKYYQRAFQNCLWIFCISHSLPVGSKKLETFFFKINDFSPFFLTLDQFFTPLAIGDPPFIYIGWKYRPRAFQNRVWIFCTSNSFPVGSKKLKTKLSKIDNFSSFDRLHAYLQFFGYKIHNFYTTWAQKVLKSHKWIGLLGNC